MTSNTSSTPRPRRRRDAVLSAAAALMGRQGGKARTPLKIKTARLNGRKGGRPVGV
jgi:DNA-binding transcriptional regulator YbjK